MTSAVQTTIRRYTVTGMTCHHCALSVSEEVGDAAGVERAEVDLASGRLEVTGAGFDDETIVAAVEAAGYEVAS
jgi:copper chaperone CopZ